jgi:hypothetical protein
MYYVRGRRNLMARRRGVEAVLIAAVGVVVVVVVGLVAGWIKGWLWRGWELRGSGG